MSAPSQIAYTFAPAISAPSVVTHRLHITVSGGSESVPPSTLDTKPGTNWPEVIGEVGSTLALTVTDLDAEGRESVPGAALTLTVVDDLPPEVPGAPTLVSHRRVIAAPPAEPTKP